MYTYLAQKEVISSGRNTKFHVQCPTELVTTKTRLKPGVIMDESSDCDVLPITILASSLSAPTSSMCSYKNKQIILS